MKKLLIWSLAISAVPAVAFAQLGCGLAPLKPLTPIGCYDTKPVCVCETLGNDCKWAFECIKTRSSPSSSRPRVNSPDTPMFSSIVDAIQTPQSPSDSMGKALALRKLQLQNQQLKQQIAAEAAAERRKANPEQSVEKEADSEGHATPQVAEDKPSAPVNRVSNGRVWKALSPDQRGYYVLALRDLLRFEDLQKQFAVYLPGALSAFETAELTTQFYSEPANLLIEIPAAIRVSKLKFEGAQQSSLDEIIGDLRKSAVK